MKNLAKALAVFAAGSVGALLLLICLKFIALSMLGEAVFRLDHLQLERFKALVQRTPITNAKLLILGDSTAAYSIDAKSFSDAEAFSFVNSTTVEAFYTLKKILDSGSQPKCLMASFSFQWELSREFFWPMFVAGDFYTEKDLAEIEEVRQAQRESSGAFLNGVKRHAAKSGLYDINTLGQIQSSIFRLKWAQAHTNAMRATLSEHKGSQIMRDSTGFAGRTDMIFPKYPHISGTEREYLNRLLKLARDRGIPVFIVRIPFAQSVPLEDKLRYWQKYDEILMAAEAPLRLATPPSMPEDLYIGAGHLNTKGVTALTPHLLHAVESCFQ